jgi:hypothetical protein
LQKFFHCINDIQGANVRSTSIKTAFWLAAVFAVISTGGTQARPRRPENKNGVSTVDLDPSRKGLVKGTGIESQDIISMTDQMARDMFANGFLNGHNQAPRIIIDEQYFHNEGSQIINRRLITDRLRVELNRAAQGRMMFVGRQYAGMVAEERDLKRSGVTDVGTTGLTAAQAGADYRLAGTISTLDSRDPNTGIVQRYNQITFDMVDLETGALVWEGMYEIKRAAADDVIYR